MEQIVLDLLIVPTIMIRPTLVADHCPTPRAVTYPANSRSTGGSEAVLEPVENSITAAFEKTKRRSTSPVGRLKGALKSRRSTNNIYNNWKKGEAGTNKLKISAESNRGSAASRIGLIFPDKREAPPLPAPPLVNTPKRCHTETYTPPRTPSSGKSAPRIFATPPTPTKKAFPPSSSELNKTSSESEVTRSDVVASAPRAPMSSNLAQTRSASAKLASSKLSSTTPTPSTTACSVTPGQGSFFSTVISAAQNAANTLSSSIGNTSVPSGTSRSKDSSPDLKCVVTPEIETVTEEVEPAVKTLGMGDLSLSHLGISDTPADTGSTTSFKLPDVSKKKKIEITNDEPTVGISRSFTTGNISTMNHNNSSTELDEIPSVNRPRTAYELVDLTPPNGSVIEEKFGPQRSNSSRSVVGSRRKRGSSAATAGATIGAAIVAANNSLVAPKITGFAVASKKRNRDFHQLFRSVPDDDYLIEDYSCALQREILAHGRLYVSEGHLCFSSNIFGWVTTLVISFDEIVSVEKRSTALVFKNGLMISTLHAKNVFASFTSRDSTYDLIVGIWKLGHPTLRSSLNGVHIAETNGLEKNEKSICNTARGSQCGTGSDSNGDGEDDIYNEDEEDEDGMSFTHVDGSVAGSDISQTKAVSKKQSGAINSNAISVDKIKEADAAGTPAPDSFPGPLTHGPTECSEPECHYTKIIADEILPAPLGRIWNHVFGQASITWIRKFLTVDQKCHEYTLEENAKKPLGLDNKVRNYSYIKPLTGPIGPKQTKCICTETLEFLDFEKSITVTISTQTPDVPSGNVFCTKTRYCFSWGDDSTTRLQMNFAVEWSGKSWLKGPIEKGAADGQAQYAKDIITALRNTISLRRGTMAVVPKVKRVRVKGKEHRSTCRITNNPMEPLPKVQEWGLYEPLSAVLGPIFNTLRPFLTGNIFYGLLVGLVLGSWFRFGLMGNLGNKTGFGWRESQGMTAYEDIWRGEEIELWRWLEDRVSMEQLRDVNSMPHERKEMERKLRSGPKFAEEEMEDAIRITEERLGLLKKSVEAARAKKSKRD